MLKSEMCKSATVHIAATIVAAAMAVFFVCGLQETAYAADAGAGGTAYRGEDTSLTLMMVYEDNGTSNVIPGVTSEAYLVATLDQASNTYTLLPEYAAVGADFNTEMSASKMMEYAAQMAEIAQSSSTKGISATSDAKGIAAFGNVEPGVYLVVQTGRTGEATGYKSYDPFLINVPQFEDGKATCDVVAYPKPTPEKAPVPDKPKKPTPQKAPQTGDDVNLWLWGGCAIAGAVIIVIALIARRRINRG